MVLAGCGVPVAKHGNRAVSSKTGATDVLTALGVNIDCDFRLIEKAIAEAGVGFLMAPRHHGAMRHVGPTRVELGRSEEHTSELQSLMRISYAVFCLKKHKLQKLPL